MIIFSDSRDPIFNSRDPIRVPKTPSKNPALMYSFKGEKCFCLQHVRLRCIRSVNSTWLRKPDEAVSRDQQPCSGSADLDVTAKQTRAAW